MADGQTDTQNIAVAVAPKPDSRLLSWAQLAVAVFAICVTLASGMMSGVAQIRGDIQIVKDQNSLQEVRLNNLERKNEGYDRLIEKRSEQLGLIQTDLATIKESLAAMNREQTIERERKGK